MRPIDRGNLPEDEKGNPKIYKEYVDARRDLIDRIGSYCTYCNQKLPTSLAVEHIQPKVTSSNLELDWNNFLLACTNCNSTKGKKAVNLNDYLWPDMHNTHWAFLYNIDGTIEINPILDEIVIQKAQNLLDLVGLQKYVDTPQDRDRRWKNRFNEFQHAKDVLKLYLSASNKGAESEFIPLLVSRATESGFFSVWMTVFNEFPQIKRALIKGFKGTALNAFDIEGNSSKRTELL
jgi:uncharacterized protein (TIGR02646 family)